MSDRRRTRGHVPSFDRCEGRSLATLIFVLNGAAFGATRPSRLTADAARVLQGAGHRVVQLSTPKLTTPAAFDQVARDVAARARGRPIGLVGFSAGGSLAGRLAGVESLRVKAVLNNYGPPDLGDWLAQHRGDDRHRYVAGEVGVTPGLVRRFSGPARTSAYVVAAFGRDDRTVTAAESLASFAADFPGGHAYTYPGAHGAPITASRPALADFLAHV